MKSILKKVKQHIAALGQCELYEWDFFSLDMTDVILELKKLYHVVLVNAAEAKKLEKSGWHYLVHPKNTYLLSIHFTETEIAEGVSDWEILERERLLGLRPWEE